MSLDKNIKRKKDSDFSTKFSDKRIYEFLKDAEPKKEIHYAECRSLECMKEKPEIVHVVYDTWYGKKCCICEKIPEEKVMNFGPFIFCFCCVDEALRDIIKKKTKLLEK
jgi:hypothetical protein